MREPKFCPRIDCKKEMDLIHISETDFEVLENYKWTYVFYWCSDCNRTLMVNRRTDTIRDKEGRI